MITVRKAKDRGKVVYDWLNTYHTFSFGEYYDPKHMHFGALRVVNEDTIKPATGFPMHSHQNMEILTYIISGTLEHKDSLGNISQITKGEIQLMEAGTGINHSEYNPSDSEEVHLLQIWVIPNKKGLKPSYQQKQIDLARNINRLNLLISATGENGSFTIAQDAKVYASIINNSSINHQIQTGRRIWLQIVSGAVNINGVAVSAGDGVAITDEVELKIAGHGEFLLFDLA